TDEFHGLEAEEIHLGVAGAGAVSEEDEQDRKDAAADQRDETEIAEEALEIDAAERGQQDTAGNDALREIDEHQGVAHGVAEADHETEPDAAEQHDGGQQPLVAAEIAQAPEDVNEEEGRQEVHGRPAEGTAELRRRAHDEQRLEIAELVAVHERADAAD